MHISNYININFIANFYILLHYEIIILFLKVKSII
jgi:hypothetical protein